MKALSISFNNIRCFAATIATMLTGAMAIAQEAAPALPAAPVEAPGTHFGIPDSTLLWVLAGMAVVMTIVIVLINDSIKNLAKTSSLWTGKNLGNKGFIIVFMFLSGQAMAADSAAPAAAAVAPFVVSDATIWGLIGANLFMILFAWYQINILRNMTRHLRGEVEVVPAYVERESWVAVAWRKVNGLRKQEQEADIMMDHDYDGIKELDNVLPPWWKYGFYLCIAWSAVYLIHYHVTKTGTLQIAEYENDVKRANAEVAAYLASKSLNVDENTVELVMDEARLKNGKSVFDKNCVQCHSANGEGGVGPCFNDNFWIHGGSISEIFKTIKYGVPQKGMVPWEATLTEVEIQNVATYIVSLEGKATCIKEPQGTPYDRNAAAAEEAAKAAAEAVPADSTVVAEQAPETAKKP